MPEGHLELDPTCATAWVNDKDWLTYIVAVLGGCDGDDAVWVMPFSDASDNGQQKVLLWRSPNQLGEYVVLQPTADTHEIAWDVPGRKLSYPHMESCLLPHRIDRLNYQYGELREASSGFQSIPSYSIAAMASTIQRAVDNQGTLGSFCNVTMMCKAIYGRLPDYLPATLEDVIDGSVKTGLDLSPVKAWNQMALMRMVKHGQANASRAMPHALMARLPEWLRAQAVPATSHWLDTLTAAMEQHKAQYWADAEALATEACPPLALFEYGRHCMHIGKDLRHVYSRIFRQASQSEHEGLDLLDTARVASEAFLQQWPVAKRPFMLLGAAANLYVQGPQNGEPVRDALIWQLGAKHTDSEIDCLNDALHIDPHSSGRLPGIAQQMLAALRHIGLLGDPLWTASGAVLFYEEAPSQKATGVPVKLNGVWLNWLNTQNGHAYSRMSDVPADVCNQAKARIGEFVQEKFQNMLLSTEITDNNRVVTRTSHGNLFGYVQRDHELAAVRHEQWRIAWAHAVDGNVLAVLEPAA